MLAMFINSTYNTVVYAVGQLRSLFWSIFLKKIGKRVDIMSGVKIMSPQKVSIGHDVLLNDGTKIGGQKGVTIGNYVMISYNVNIVSENHEYRNPLIPMKKQGYFGGPIVIKDDVWIGANAVILPSITIGRGSVIGANAVVTKDVADFAVVGGVPAKLIKYRSKRPRKKKLMTS